MLALLSPLLVRSPGAEFAFPLLVLVVLRFLAVAALRRHLARPNNAPLRSFARAARDRPPLSPPRPLSAGGGAGARARGRRQLRHRTARARRHRGGAASGWLFKLALITLHRLHAGFALQRVPARTPATRTPWREAGWN